MKRKKILFVITQSEWGGAQKYVFDLATGFSQKKYEITVAIGKVKNSSNKVDLSKRLASRHIEVCLLNNLVRSINPVKDFLAFWELYFLVKKRNPDVVLLNSTKAGILGAPASFLAGCKNIILTAHGFVFNEPSSWLRHQFYILATKFSVIFLRKIITVSNFDYQSGLKIGINPHKMVVIHNGIEALNFLSKEEAKKILQQKINKKLSSELIIGTVAHFYSNKGLNFLIEAVASIKNNFQFPISNFQLLIVGDGEQRPYLESLIKKYELDNIFLVGEIKDAYKYFKAFDIFVLPSVKEGLPFVLLEAMMAELPIVASRVGGVPEVVENRVNGLLIKPTDVKELANALSQLLSNPLKRQKFGNTSLAKVKEEFSFEEMIEETEKQLLYRHPELVSGSK